LNRNLGIKKDNKQTLNQTKWMAKSFKNFTIGWKNFTSIKLMPLLEAI